MLGANISGIQENQNIVENKASIVRDVENLRVDRAPPSEFGENAKGAE